MSYGETITRTDLTNILNEVLPVSFSLSSVKEVTLPFTPTSNGLLLVLIRAVNQGRFYVAYSNATPGLVDAYQVASGYTTAVSFVEKGKQVAQTDSMNLQQKFFYFVSLGNDSLADYVVEQGTSGIWTYRKWNSGVAEAWGNTLDSFSMTNALPNSLYYGKKTFTISSLPFISISSINVTGNCAAYYVTTKIETYSTTSIELTAMSTASRTDNIRHNINIIGKWK